MDLNHQERFQPRNRAKTMVIPQKAQIFWTKITTNITQQIRTLETNFLKQKMKFGPTQTHMPSKQLILIFTSLLSTTKHDALITKKQPQTERKICQRNVKKQSS